MAVIFQTFGNQVCALAFALPSPSTASDRFCAFSKTQTVLMARFGSAAFPGLHSNSGSSEFWPVNLVAGSHNTQGS